MKSAILYFLLLTSFALNAQEVSLEGYLSDIENQPLEGVIISLPQQQKGDISDASGYYQLEHLKAGKVKVTFDGLGFKTVEKTIELHPGKNTLNFNLEENPEDLDEVMLISKTASEKLRESAFEVSVLDTKAYKNLNGDLKTLLSTAPGVNIRETGGLGSSFDLSLNGLSGNQIRFFIDGIPMEGTGSSISLNNFPVNLIKNIQVYKGVVPISLGADALGGAINITTDSKKKSFLDASYTYGSFNTHRIAVNGQYTNREQKYYIRLLSYFNHSDNDYEMKAVPLYELELGNYFGEVSAKRFHSAYTSGMGQLQTGLFDRTWADEISLAFTYAENVDDQQHSAYSIERVFGDLQVKDQYSSANLKYRKVWNRLKVSAYASYGEREQQAIDTSSYRYNWAGERWVRSEEDLRGELADRKSFLVLQDRLLRSNLQATYELTEKSDLSFSVTQNSTHREGEDRVNEFNTTIEFPKELNKNIIGLSYNYKLSEGLTLGIFGKQYLFHTEITTEDLEDNLVFNEEDSSHTGFGGIATYFINDQWQLKFSYENAMRLPETTEILGDGLYVNTNANLQPEKSDNINLGFRHNLQRENFRLKTSGNAFLRNSKDFIRFQAKGPFGSYENLENARSLGGELSIQTHYKKWQASINATYQHITDQTKTDEGLPNVNYESRVPNKPYFFGNFRLGYKVFDHEKLGILQTHWNARYVHEYFLFWENQGRQDTKALIPSQFANNFHVEYSAPSQRYHVSASINNIFDEALYDNFRIQKPGRAFYVKLRYYLN